MYSLTNVLRPYAWGSTTAIAQLLGREPSGSPEAELWLGAHPDSPSQAVLPDGTAMALDALIQADPEAALGSVAQSAFGDKLPFLLKILAAEQPLSLQVHPTQEQARAGFAAEEAAGVPRTAAERNYKDDNHKPEMILALTHFAALCGFRPIAGTLSLLEDLASRFEEAGEPEPSVLAEVRHLLAGEDERAALRAAFELLISGGTAVEAATAATAALLRSGAPHSADSQYAAELSTVVSLQELYPTDPGVLISLLLNRVSLSPGEAIYLPAGNIHAYLRGMGVEVMASSDNVLRGGLTAKYVDVPELMKTVDFAAQPVPLIAEQTTELGQQLWTPPFREFALQRAELRPDDGPVPLAQNGPLLLIAVSGSVLLDSPRGDLRLERGGSAFIPAYESPILLHPVSGAAENAVVFAVTIPPQP
ncbi:mannose-6-phosphate isomerase, class I [Paenarthrobacter sp. Z7-10]|uniref:mannose-6-phosphate isomerase, class I n=1 Tax=Paenarthrobacter sp. Z7-10 TaxID=2787635 RepID=UPI0022A994EA|nr:mannose-6-phosphate isomerase, class I [Paenarthrobacter sp. Z7-10]MCZ2403243.1 mannose-6-phosphate isomerase, class I [Paenarthrobacter sp. Z7-10]